jgi:hypothetical protein
MPMCDVFLCPLLHWGRSAADAIPECARKYTQDTSNMQGSTEDAFICTDYEVGCKNGRAKQRNQMLIMDNECVWCNEGYYLENSVCNDCSKSKSATCLWPGQYRSGSCGGETNTYACNNQPTCGQNEYLQGAAKAVSGTCEPCTSCEEKQYQVAPCSATSQTECKSQDDCAEGSYLAVPSLGKKGRSPDRACNCNQPATPCPTVPCLLVKKPAGCELELGPQLVHNVAMCVCVPAVSMPCGFSYNV